jgi:hypothetical protein
MVKDKSKYKTQFKDVPIPRSRQWAEYPKPPWEEGPKPKTKTTLKPKPGKKK